MPCRTDEPTYQQAEIQRVAKFILFVHERLFGSLEFTDTSIVEIANSDWPSVKRIDELTGILCSLCGKWMDDEDRAKIIYNGYDPVSRKLADWWDKHKEFDKSEGREHD